MAVFTADNKAFSYMGRTDFSDIRAPLIIYPGANIKFGFTGSSLSVEIENISMTDDPQWLGAVIDGVQHKYELKKETARQTVLLSEGLDSGAHTCMIFKRQAAAHYFRFLSVQAESVYPVPTDYSLKLEFFGDSVSAGEVTEAVYYEGMSDPENHHGMYDNSYFSYTFMTARKLNAQFHNNSQGGIALFDHTGYFYGPDIATLTGLESTYDKLSYVPYAPCGVSKWDFSCYTPDFVIFAIGQNDAHPNPDAVFDKEYTERWKARYKEILLDLKERYKTARFIIITTVLKHEAKWEYILDELCAELADPDVTRLKFKRAGLATDGHPRITEQEEMAQELSAYIRSLKTN
ncbi:MAG: lipase [Ruminiclostridium sp.]|nr:lipase [Ruminiclostridium sp.]